MLIRKKIFCSLKNQKLFREAQKYLFKPDQLHKLQKCSEIENFEKRGRSLLVVVSTPPTENYEKFTEKVREYNTKEPFNFMLPVLFNNYIKVNIVCLFLTHEIECFVNKLISICFPFSLYQFMQLIYMIRWNYMHGLWINYWSRKSDH